MRAPGGDPAPDAGGVVEGGGFIFQDERVGGVGGIDLARYGGEGGEVVFPSGEDVDAFALFEVVGVLEVDDGGGVNPEDGAAFGSSAAEFLLVLAFEGGEFRVRCRGRWAGRDP